MIAGAFDAAKAAWARAERQETIKLTAISYFVLSDEEKARANVADYYAGAGAFTKIASETFPPGAKAIRERATAFEALGVDELIFNPTIADLNEISRLAEVVP